MSQDQLAPGDLVFYGHPIHHVGMYIGNGQYVHAPQTGDVVKVASIFRSDWAGAAARLIPGSRPPRDGAACAPDRGMLARIHRQEQHDGRQQSRMGSGR